MKYDTYANAGMNPLMATTKIDTKVKLSRTKIVNFEKYLRSQERSKNTIDSYVKSVDLYYREYDELSKSNLIEFKRSQMETHKPKTAALRCVSMNVFCDFVGANDLKVKGVKLAKATAVENVITMTEYQYFLSRLYQDNKMKLYWILKYLAGTGCRISELVKLEKSCLETGEFTLWTKGKYRRILIPKHLIRESKSFFSHGTSYDKLNPNSPYLFTNRYGEQITTRGVTCLIKKYGRRYGIREEVLHPHAFRHLFAIQFLKRTKDISLLSDLLGHESLNTTAIYLRLSASEQKRQFDRVVNW